MFEQGQMDLRKFLLKGPEDESDEEEGEEGSSGN